MYPRINGGDLSCDSLHWWFGTWRSHLLLPGKRPVDQQRNEPTHRILNPKFILSTKKCRHRGIEQRLKEYKPLTGPNWDLSYRQAPFHNTISERLYPAAYLDRQRHVKPNSKWSLRTFLWKNRATFLQQTNSFLSQQLSVANIFPCSGGTLHPLPFSLLWFGLA